MTLILNVPTYIFNTNLSLLIVPTDPVSMFSSIKICSVVPISSGENIPCPNCLNQGIATYNTQRFSWDLDKFQNLGIRSSPTDVLNANQFR
jgi:hypothetical protein